MSLSQGQSDDPKKFYRRKGIFHQKDGVHVLPEVCCLCHVTRVFVLVLGVSTASGIGVHMCRCWWPQKSISAALGLEKNTYVSPTSGIDSIAWTNVRVTPRRQCIRHTLSRFQFVF